MIWKKVFGYVLLAGLLASSPFRSGMAAGLQTALAPASGGTLRGIVIGVDAYDNFVGLHGAVADAKDIASALARAGAAEVFLLTNANARRRSVVATMDHLVRTARPGDMIVVAFSGHGNRVPELPAWRGLEPGGMNEEFVLAGYGLEGPATAEVVMNKEMKGWLARLDAKGADVLFVADSCFGGGMTRAVDPRAGRLTYRTLRNAAVPPDRDRFRPIDLTRQELLVSIGDLSHVTFLAGGDAEHLVPEITIPGDTTPRGALSYAVARALEGRAADPKTGATTRYSLLAYALQIVQQYTDGNQLLDAQPKTDDEAILARVLLRPAAAPGAPLRDPPAPVERVAASYAIPLAIIDRDGTRDGQGDAQSAGLGQGTAAFTITRERDGAKLIWDRATGEVLDGGDVIKRGVAAADIPGIVDRTWAIAEIKKMSEVRPQRIDLAAGGKLYTETACDREHATCPSVRITDVEGRRLIVFNIAAQGRIQLLNSKAGPDAVDPDGTWHADLHVAEPLGADCIVAVASRRRLGALEDWLRDHDQQPAAALVVARLREAVASDPSLTIGTVGVFTAP